MRSVTFFLATVCGTIGMLGAGASVASATGTGIVAFGQDGGGLVRVYDTNDGSLLISFQPYGADFTGGVRVAIGDVTEDGVDDLIVAPAKGAQPVRVYEGNALLIATATQLTQFFPYGTAFSAGIFIAAGKFTNDDADDIVTGPGGGPPTVLVFDADDLTGLPIITIAAYAPDFTSGVRVAVGEITPDGTWDIVTGPGAGKPPLVRVYSGATSALWKEFLAYDVAFTGGVFVACGNVIATGKADIITGPGKGPPDVRIFDAEDINAAGGVPVAEQFNAWDTSYTKGVRVGYCGALLKLMFGFSKGKGIPGAGYNSLEDTAAKFFSAGEDGAGDHLLFVQVFRLWTKGLNPGG